MKERNKRREKRRKNPDKSNLKHTPGVAKFLDKQFNAMVDKTEKKLLLEN